MFTYRVHLATALALGAGIALLAGAAGARAEDHAPRAGAASLARPGLAVDLSTLGTDVDGPDRAGPSDTDTLDADQDGFISSAQPDANFGGSDPLYVGDKSPYGATRAAVQFDLSELPRDRAVTEARLRLYLGDAGPSGDVREIPIYRITSSWQEGGATWNTCNDCVDPKRWDSVNLGTAQGWYEWTSTELVQRWRWPSWQDWSYKNHGFGVQGYEADGSYRGFNAREDDSGPQLQLTHVADEAAPSSALKPMTSYLNAPDSGKDYVTMKLSWDGSDPAPATGVDFFWILVKTNNSGFVGLVSDDNDPPNDWRRYDTEFRGYNGKVYHFVTYGTDMAGNREPDKPNPDWITHVDWSAPATTMTALPPYVRGDIQLSWSGQDLPQGTDLVPSGVQTFELWFNVNNSSWGLAETLPGDRLSTVFVNPLDNAIYKFQIIGVDKAGNRTAFGDGQTQTLVDFAPPTASLLPITKTLPALTFPVSWSGNDGIGSGVDSFDVESSVGTGAWTAWQTGTRSSSASFTGQLGNVYGFRVRAKDKAGNVGAWSLPEYAAVIQPSALQYSVRLPSVNR